MTYEHKRDGTLTSQAEVDFWTDCVSDWPQDRCWNCQHWDMTQEPRWRHKEVVLEGQCRKNAPQLQKESGSRFAWVFTKPLTWCGEFTPKCPSRLHYALKRKRLQDLISPKEEDDDTLGTDERWWKFSARARRVLRWQAKIKKLEELSNFTCEGLLSYKNCGVRTVAEIQEVAKELGIELKPSPRTPYSQTGPQPSEPASGQGEEQDGEQA